MTTIGGANSPLAAYVLTPSERKAKITNISREAIDIWEHAALLFHNYAWQVSADTFYVLASWLQDTDSRNLCLLNAAMIQARLGDSHIAADTLRKVNANGDLHLFEMFVSGIVNCELGDAARAEACFETCLDGLSDHSIEYAVPAMTFTLSSSVVKDNLIALREAQFAARLEGTSFTALNGVPADYIFEAPVSWPSQDTSGESSETMRDLPTLKTVVAGSANVDRTETGHTPGQNKAIPRSVPLPSRASISSSIYSINNRWSSSDTDKAFSFHPPAHSPSSLQSAAVGPFTASTPSPKAFASSLVGFTKASVGRHLGRIIRSPSTRVRLPAGTTDSPSSGEMLLPIPVRELSPRDARGEYPSLTELGQFAKQYAPALGSDNIPAHPLHVDLYLPLKNQSRPKLAITAPGNTSSPSMAHRPTKGAAIQQMPPDRARNIRAKLPTLVESAIASPLELSSPVQPELELLQPKVFQPATEGNAGKVVLRADLSSPDDKKISLFPAPLRSNKQQQAPDVDAEVHRARAQTLRILEDNATSNRIQDAREVTLQQAHKNKPLPRPPLVKEASWSNSDTSVATTNFFETVLGREKRYGYH